MSIESEAAALSSTAQTVVSADKIAADLDEIQQNIEEIKENPSLISEYLHELPAKALSLGVRVLLIILIFLIGTKLIKFLRKIMRKGLERYGVSSNVISFLDTVVKYTLYITLVLGLAVNLGIDASTVVALIGSIGVTIGLALQGSLSNFAGGVLLLIMKPFVAGDYICDVKTGLMGTVDEVHIFYTKIITDNGYEAMIPNGSMSNNSIINYSRHSVRQLIQEFGISYESDIDKARKILLDIIDDEPSLVREGKPAPYVYVKKLDESSVNLELRAYLDNESNLDFLKVQWHLNELAKKKFDQNGIVIPYNQVDVHLTSQV